MHFSTMKMMTNIYQYLNLQLGLMCEQHIYDVLVLYPSKVFCVASIVNLQQFIYNSFTSSKVYSSSFTTSESSDMVTSIDSDNDETE